MKNLSLIVEENKREAIDLLKQHGGRIDFVEDIIHNNPDDYEEDDFLGSIGDFSCPIVLVDGCDCNVEPCVVLSVIYDDEKDCLMAWVRDIETRGEVLDDWLDCSFANYSEDDVYQCIYNDVNGIE